MLVYPSIVTSKWWDLGLCIGAQIWGLTWGGSNEDGEGTPAGSKLFFFECEISFLGTFLLLLHKKKFTPKKIPC